MNDLKSPTCRWSVCPSIAADVVFEARSVLESIPTGEWRRSLRERVSAIEGKLQAWQEDKPTFDELKTVTAVALDLFCDIGDAERR